VKSDLCNNAAHGQGRYQQSFVEGLAFVFGNLIKNLYDWHLFAGMDRK
jgi:hypothetical protein